ncbi:hypothetical protein FCK90_03530 [Kocuria coralli]|uniref:Uncharacterized protein n=1 Tax=Kocuria coralli TaxID=1461025 RepID=A0A5J5KZ91_9MICC|nr:hypothetical protein [Kocuria coralli]KAA9394994.1 hypothetical protein FCK90_03530 [Kocuria coralli]
MPRLLPPADAGWERRRPLRLVLLTATSYVLLLATIWVQTHDPEIVAAVSSAPDGGAGLSPGPGWATAGGLALLYGVPLVLWWRKVPYVLHLMAGLCILGGVVFALSATTGFLWNWRVGVVPLAGVLVNIAWLVLAYRRDRV